MARAMILWLWPALLLGVTLAASAAIEVRHFDDPELQQRYATLTHELRCPKCQNQSIAESDSPIAADMRDKVAERLAAGRSDAAIRDFLVRRFGEYVLYDPRLSARTWLLWGLPAGLVALGALIVALIVRSRRRAANRSLSADERARLDELIRREERS